MDRLIDWIDRYIDIQLDIYIYRVSQKNVYIF
jgi:hypothetical protein